MRLQMSVRQKVQPSSNNLGGYKGVGSCWPDVASVMKDRKDIAV